MVRLMLKWGNDVALALTFLVTFVTGLIKWTVLMRTFGMTGLVLPLALVSDIHDRAGVLLGVFVATHLFINRSWIIATTRKIIRGDRQDEG
jgi:hypothetical protein